MSAEPIKIATTDRILDASLKLFNEQGFHRVPAMRIAEHLGISPGHLAYHFKKKRDILLALFPRLEAALQETFKLEFSHAAPQSIDRTLYVLKALWSYRFFFIELPQIAPVDREVMDSFVTLEEDIIDTMSNSFDKRISEGAMRPVVAPNTTSILAKSVWITWLAWIAREQLKYPGQATPSPESVFDAMFSAYCVVQPYFAEGFLDEIAEALKKRLAIKSAITLNPPAISVTPV